VHGELKPEQGSSTGAITPGAWKDPRPEPACASRELRLPARLW
jgi:hypothetical protein